MNLFNQLLLLVVFKVHVPLGKSRLPSAVLNQDKPNLLIIRQISRVVIIYIYPTIVSGSAQSRREEETAPREVYSVGWGFGGGLLSYTHAQCSGEREMTTAGGGGSPLVFPPSTTCLWYVPS